ncbi:HesA/MoeB/ThiF family protein [Exiguobacterium sp. KJ 601]|uniref:HesA/MoeB/ThiF family protein n=1 Tax=Exiguobacterium sp. KJ 601 TaxID=2782569 RepID=UPI0022AF864F|nr:ThiF family adenylyltransferase [Exiguobacterium sp. KJ 601]
MKVPNESLLTGRRATEFVEGIEIIDDLKWIEPIKKWVLHCSLYSDEIEHAVINKCTEWYILIDDAYPRGSIGFYPSKRNSLTQTFPHQMYNYEDNNNYPWRNGLLCLDSNVRTLGRLVPNEEPYQEEVRLTWHVIRAIEWLIAASKNKLTSQDELFELIDFPEFSSLKLGFSEDSQSFMHWNSIKVKYGIATFSVLHSGVFLVREFKKLNGLSLRNNEWGYHSSQVKSDDRILGSWILLKEVPHFKPWQAPLTWSELTEICKNQKIDILSVLRQINRKQNCKKKLVHILLIGFPIKEKLNEDYSEIFWKGVEIPFLIENSLNPKRVKLDIKQSNKIEKQVTINGLSKIKWMHSFNWSKSAVMSRGMLPKKISDSKILLIGAGALGSSVGELLVRAGVEKLGIIDYDNLEMGNLTRHTLLLNEIGNNKAEALTKRLNKTSLHSKVESHAGTLKYNLENNIEQLRKYNVILDCTGDDEVLMQLQQYQWSDIKQFISISLGFEGRKLFLFSNYSFYFHYDLFRECVDPWLADESTQFNEKQLPREGLGCWHPLFPARADDVWILAATAIKKLEAIYNETKFSTFSIYEQENSDGNFQGINLVHNEVINE